MRKNMILWALLVLSFVLAACMPTSGDRWINDEVKITVISVGIGTGSSTTAVRAKVIQSEIAEIEPGSVQIFPINDASAKALVEDDKVTLKCYVYKEGSNLKICLV